MVHGNFRCPARSLLGKNTTSIVLGDYRVVNGSFDVAAGKKPSALITLQSRVADVNVDLGGADRWIHRDTVKKVINNRRIFHLKKAAGGTFVADSVAGTSVITCDGAVLDEDLRRSEYSDAIE